MLARCLNPKHVAYPRYGGRGITIAPKWRRFAAFLRDMGPRPAGTTLERKNGAKGYSKANCCWASRSTQARNRRDNVFITHAGKTQCVADWSKETGIGITTLLWRRAQHWPSAQILNPDRSMGKGQSKKTHCPAGHAYTPENTAIGANGHRKCKECNKLRARERRAAHPN